MKLAHGLLSLVLALALATPSFAVTRTRSMPLLGRTALSGYFGLGVPAGDFSSQASGMGNHDTPGYHWAVEVEHYFAPELSIGFAYNGARYEDKDLADSLRTNLTSWGGFLKYTVPTGTDFHPYMWFGMKGMEVEFDSPRENVDADYSFAVDFGAGLALMLGRMVSINGAIGYAYGWTEEAYIPAADAIVGFDVSYWEFLGGLSFYFP